MLNADDPNTTLSVRLLREVVAKGRRMVIWVGAGASRWLGYPSWDDLAREVRLDFFKHVGGFDNDAACKLIQAENYPDFFQLCKGLDAPRYFSHLSRVFEPREPSHTHLRFTDLLQRLPLLQLVTTNIDEALERTIPGPLVLQNTDATRIVDLLEGQSSFIAKLHGSSSSIESAVFSTTDYQRLLENAGFVATVGHIFRTCSVLFVGYGVRDRYVIDLLSRNADERRLFGAGPHFAVTNEDDLPSPDVRAIRYSIRLHPDHRAAMSVLDLLRESIQLTNDDVPLKEEQAHTLHYKEQVPPGGAGYFISDFKPPGTWSTSQTVHAQSADGEGVQCTIGLGFTNDEVPFKTSTALHDLVVGLTCFDAVYLPVLAVAPAHAALGSEVFWELVNSDSIKFVHSLHEPAVVFGDRVPDPFGTLVSLTPRSKDGSAPRSALELIRRSIGPAPGRAAEAEALIVGLEKRCVTFGEFEWELPTEIRGALLMPQVSRLLGVGEAILPSQVPRWLTFPYLRMAHLVQTGFICAALGLKAAKVPFGSEKLVNGAFGLRTVAEFAEQATSFVFSGNYNTDLGAMVQQEPTVFRSILRFRESQEGQLFRKEVSDVLSVPLGAEFAASVNAGLRKSVPTTLLQRAKDRLSFLLTNHARTIPTPAVWGNTDQSDRVTRFWRAKSLKLLLEICDSRGIGRNDACICGSGDKLRLCCMHPLRP